MYNTFNINKLISVNDNKTFNIIETIIRTTICKFHPSEVAVLKILMQDIGEPVNTYQLKERGIKSPRQCIYRLRCKGVDIITITQDVVNNAGILRKGVARYFFRGLSNELLTRERIKQSNK